MILMGRLEIEQGLTIDSVAIGKLGLEEIGALAHTLGDIAAHRHNGTVPEICT